MEQAGTPRMEREAYRRQWRGAAEDGVQHRPPKTGQQMLLRLIGLQAALCALVLAAVFAAGRLSPTALERMRQEYARITARDLSVSELFGQLRQGGRQVRSRLESAAPAAAEATLPAAAPVTAAASGSVTDVTVVSDETGETVAVAVVEDGAGGGDLGERAAAEGATFAPYTVSAAPVMPVRSARITSPFGWRTNPVSGNYGFHTGLDLAAPEGTPVAAAFYGTVEEIGEDDVWGKYVLLRHSDSLETYYCHLSGVNVTQGAVLRSGEIIGFVGSTGWSTGPHLHFEVRIGGVRVDPERLLFPAHFDDA
ncbi:MAG: M23 family metallopeptidase [Clostridia bacterium]|nr:M23 family metallopeptidase [Clostridia bacterium]